MTNIPEALRWKRGNPRAAAVDQTANYDAPIRLRMAVADNDAEFRDYLTLVNKERKHYGSGDWRGYVLRSNKRKSHSYGGQRPAGSAVKRQKKTKSQPTFSTPDRTIIDVSYDIPSHVVNTSKGLYNTNDVSNTMDMQNAYKAQYLKYHGYDVPQGVWTQDLEDTFLRVARLDPGNWRQKPYGANGSGYMSVWDHLRKANDHFFGPVEFGHNGDEYFVDPSNVAGTVSTAPEKPFGFYHWLNNTKPGRFALGTVLPIVGAGALGTAAGRSLAYNFLAPMYVGGKGAGVVDDIVSAVSPKIVEPIRLNDGTIGLTTVPKYTGWGDALAKLTNIPRSITEFTNPGFWGGAAIPSVAAKSVARRGLQLSFKKPEPGYWKRLPLKTAGNYAIYRGFSDIPAMGDVINNTLQLSINARNAAGLNNHYNGNPKYDIIANSLTEEADNGYKFTVQDAKQLALANGKLWPSVNFLRSKPFSYYEKSLFPLQQPILFYEEPYPADMNWLSPTLFTTREDLDNQLKENLDQATRDLVEQQ